MRNTLVRIETKQGRGIYWGNRLTYRQQKLANKIANFHRPHFYPINFDDEPDFRFSFNSISVFKQILEQSEVTEAQLVDSGLVIKYIKLKDKKYYKHLDSVQGLFDYTKALILQVKIKEKRKQ